jgi:hypothetical protein
MIIKFRLQRIQPISKKLLSFFEFRILIAQSIPIN